MMNKSNNRNSSYAALETYQPPKTEMHSIMKPEFNTMEAGSDDRKMRPSKNAS